MSHILWLIPILPLAGFLILSLAGTKISHTIVSIIAVAPTMVSFIIAGILAVTFIDSPPESQTYAQTIGTWFNVYGFNITYGFYYDALALVMTVVITFVASMILLYSVKYMQDDESYSRFFTYMNLFVASMLILVLADNFLWLYLGWEGVGLCSYLLIGFWYKEPENCRAAMKAFIVTRIGDTLLVIGLFMLVVKYGMLGIQPIMNQVSQLPKGSVFLTLTALFLLSGAVGKSAQLPLQTWLPDAMAGPTPVSALNPRRYYGNRGSVSDSKIKHIILYGSGCYARSRIHRCGNIASRGIQRFRSEGHKASSRIFDYQPNRVHVSRSRSRCLGGRYISFSHSCFFQISVVSRSRSHASCFEQ